MIQNDKMLQSWQSYYYNIGLPAELAGIYIDYARRMHGKGLPAIFEFSHLSALLGRTPEYLASAVNAPHKHYREFTIPKRSGGARTVSAPYSTLLDCQKWIYENILAHVECHPAAHGFVPNRSILTNANVHVSSRQILKIDLEDFFPSIKIGRVMSLFSDLGYPDNVSFYLSSLCSLNGALPQGAPTSPALSNIICRQLDNRLAKAASRCDLVYSRYADDLTFSGETVTWGFYRLASYIIHDEGFKINGKKTRMMQCDNGSRIITGVNVSHGKTSAPSEFKRKLRQDVHYILKFGLKSHMAKLRIRDPFYIDRIIGKVCFWIMLEPDAKFPAEALPILRAISEKFER